jgi:pimeloyl-ACP methyl ester carboxylesterase
VNSFYLPYKNSRFRCFVAGEGEKTVACFHGYGESGESFSILAPYWETEFTLIAIDFPFHGETEWSGADALHPEELWEILELILQQLGRKESPISLVGYSLGARVCLSLVQLKPEKINRLVLLAPDGLTVNPWYWLATQTAAGNSLFHSTMRKPGWFFFLLRISHKLKMANQSVVKFTAQYIGDAPARKELYHRWMVMRKFKPQLKKIRHQVLQHRITIKLLYGEHDRIILPQRGAAFISGLEEFAELITIPSGHQLLKEKNAELIASLITR